MKLLIVAKEQMLLSVSYTTFLKHIFLYADNCCGQNKNNVMMEYLSWRVITKRHTNIVLSFLVIGHTKFSPDWCFDLLKQNIERLMLVVLMP